MRMLNLQGLRILFATLTLVIAALSSAQSDPTRPVATVNGESISGMDYFRRMEFLPGMGRYIRGAYEETYPGYLALQQMINERLMLQLAAERKVVPTAQQVQELLKERLEVTPKLLESLAKVGISQADYEYQLRVELAEFNIVTQGILITDQEIDKHYKDNPSRFTSKKMYHLRMIAVSEANKSKVDDALKLKKFEDVAKELSEDPSKANGGELGEVPENVFSELVRANLERTKIGQVTPWVQGQSGWFKFLMVDIKAPVKQPLDANLRKSLRRSLMLDRGMIKNNIEKLMFEMRKKANVTIAQPGLEPLIKNWLANPLPE